MELNQSQRDAVRDKLNAKFDDQNIPDCEMCKNDAWAIDPYILELREFFRGGVFVGSPVIPLVSMHCTKCGHTKLFNAILLDVINQNTGEAIGGSSVQDTAVSEMASGKAVANGAK